MEAIAAQRSGSARIAGIVGLVGGLLGVAVAVFELVTLPAEVSVASGLRNALVHLTAIVGLAGLAALGAVGSAWWGRVGIGVAVMGFVGLISAELIEPFTPATAGTIFEIAPLVVGPGMVLAGVAVLRARRWSGWRRIVPLAVGAYVFVVFLPVVISIGSDAAFWAALVGWYLALAAIGLAVVQEASAPVSSRDRSRVA